MSFLPKLKKLGFYLTAFLPFFSAAALAADCYSDCMRGSGCWDSRSDENVSYCSGIQARCSTECRSSANSANSSYKSYGAIAYSRKDQSYGYSNGKKTRNQAEKTALQYCQEYGKKCKAAVWFYNQCGAVAADEEKVGIGLGTNTGDASQAALKECKKSGKNNCKVKIAHCSF